MWEGRKGVFDLAIDVKALLADALLELCEQKPLSKISVSDIQAQSGVSRQAFYNHFRDKQDLIQYIYLNRIIVEWADPDVDFPYYDALLKTFRRYIRYQRFLKQAILLTGQNCLADFMTDYCIEFDKTWHQRCYGDTPMPEDLCLATEYHSRAAMTMTIWWILSDMPVSPDFITDMITKMRDAGLSHMLCQRDGSSPYTAKAEGA
jgi:AcrR family transcriptional regulator